MINDQEYVSVEPLIHDEHTQLNQITMVADKDEWAYFPVLVAGGAAGSTTYMKGYLHGYKRLTSRKVFYDARKRAHVSVGECYMKLLCRLNSTSVDTHIFIQCYHTPTLPVAVLSPGRFVIHHGSKYEAYTVYVNHRTTREYMTIHAGGEQHDLYIPGILLGALVYSRAMYRHQKCHARTP
jgi:hypothetical protein